MSFFESLLLGAIQGITEFLPISSSGHLVIFQKILGFNNPPIFFDTLIHLATLVAVVIYFKKSLVKYKNPEKLKTIIIASIPAVIVGLTISSQIHKIFNSIIIVSIGLVITGTLLLFTKKIKFKSEPINPKKSIIIGLFQALAILPGISRSGSTISGGLINGISKKNAFEFSFILSIPAIIGAVTLQLISSGPIVLSIQDFFGFFAALISGLISIKILDKIINNNKLYYFGYYCLILGAAILVLPV